MAVNQMLKLNIFIHSFLLDPLLEELQKLGVLHIVDITDSFKEKKINQEFEIEQLKKKITEFNHYIDFISSFEKKKNFVDSLIEKKLVVDEKEYQETIINFNPEEVIANCKKIEEKNKEITYREQRLKAEIEKILPYQSLKVNLGKLKGTLTTQLILGKFSNIEIIHVENILKEKCNFYLEIINKIAGDIYIFLIFLKEDSLKVQEILKKYNFISIQFPEEYEGTPREILKNLKEELAQINKEKQRIFLEAKKLVNMLPKLMSISDYYFQILKKNEIKEKFINTKTSLVIEGWIRKEDIERVKKILFSKFKEIEIIASKPQEKDYPPVELKNKTVFQPFEVITNLYGRPYYTKVDPTPYLSPFFAIFFGLCLTDAGYGMVLILLTRFFLKKLQLSKQGKQLLNLLTLTGISTIFVGILTGGIFGIQFKETPTCFMWLANLRNKFMLFDPLEKPLIFFGLALGLGYCHILLGVIIKFFENIKQKKILAGIIDQLTWLFLTSSLLILLSLAMGLTLPIFVNKLAKIIALICIVTILFFKGRRYKNIFKRLLIGGYELYSVFSGTLGDILSYSRLLALGLATGIIAMVVNIIAGLILPLFTIKTNIFFKIPLTLFATIFYLFILIGGHMGNILINAIGGFIHTVRLQFVEFFTKFYESGGKEFSPFKIERKYTIIK